MENPGNAANGLPAKLQNDDQVRFGYAGSSTTVSLKPLKLSWATRMPSTERSSMTVHDTLKGCGNAGLI